jgi:hypothetical protein
MFCNDQVTFDFGSKTATRKNKGAISYKAISLLIFLVFYNSLTALVWTLKIEAPLDKAKALKSSSIMLL